MKYKFITMFEAFTADGPVTKEYQILLDDLEDVIRNFVEHIVNNQVDYSYLIQDIHDLKGDIQNFIDDLGLFTSYYSGPYSKFEEIDRQNRNDDVNMLISILGEKQYSKHFMFVTDSDSKIIKRCIDLILMDIKFLNAFLKPNMEIFKYSGMSRDRIQKITKGYTDYFKKSGKLDKILEARLKKAKNKFKFFNEYNHLFSSKLIKKYSVYKAAGEFNIFDDD